MISLFHTGRAFQQRSPKWWPLDCTGCVQGCCCVFSCVTCCNARGGCLDIAHLLPYAQCNYRHEPIGVRGFLRVLGRFFKILGLRERTKEEKHM